MVECHGPGKEALKYADEYIHNYSSVHPHVMIQHDILSVRNTRVGAMMNRTHISAHLRSEYLKHSSNDAETALKHTM